MPLYDYRCMPCSVVTEVYQRPDEQAPNCPGCAMPMERMISSPAMVKGPTTRVPLAKPITFVDEEKGKVYRIGTKKKYD